jgi:hypothetical protein
MVVVVVVVELSSLQWALLYFAQLTVYTKEGKRAAHLGLPPLWPKCVNGCNDFFSKVSPMSTKSKSGN